MLLFILWVFWSWALSVTISCCRFQESRVYFEGGYRSVQVYLLSELGAGHEIPGPAIIMDSLSTILVEPGQEGSRYVTITLRTINASCVDGWPVCENRFQFSSFPQYLKWPPNSLAAVTP